MTHPFGTAAVRVRDSNSPTLLNGTLLGRRYEVLMCLGTGGMGEVYKAKDRELDRLVALKVINPFLASDQRELMRFKQELLLARKVGHKNVVRTYDLEVVDDLKFITMDYIEGEDLAQILDKKTFLQPREAAEIVRQVCEGLQAAHAEGVIHRDLKPRNIMIDPRGRVLIMDFGLAQSAESPELTRPNEVVGSPAYMAPEQFKFGETDARSDLYSLGLIFYQLLTGRLPGAGKTAYETLQKRTEERLARPHDLNADVPIGLSLIVMKCLEREPDKRFQSALDLLQGIKVWEGKSAPGNLTLLRARHGWLALAASAAVLILALSIWWVWRNVVPPSGANKPVTLLVADFDNSTGDKILDGTLEPMFVVSMEGARFITCYERGQAHRLGAKLKPDAARLDDAVARLVALREGVATVLTGSLRAQQARYRLDIRIIDAITGRQLAAEGRSVGSREDLLEAVSKLAIPLRKALGDTTLESSQVAAAETFTAASLEAWHDYAVAQDLQLAGKYSEALRSYLQAVKLDSGLGRAYAGAATMYFNNKMFSEAHAYFQKALSHMDRMSDREKYRTRGGFFILDGDIDHAITEYTSLIRKFPSDTAGHSNLALAFFYKHDFDRAVQEGSEAVRLYPKNVSQRNNLALFQVYAGDFDAGEREATKALEMNSSFEKAYIALALSHLGKEDIGGAEKSYERMEKISARGASMAADGLADCAILQGRLRDAEAMLQQGSTKDLAGNDRSAAARKLALLANVRLFRGQGTAAVAAADLALGTAREHTVIFSAARTYLEAGREEKTRALISELQAVRPPAAGFALEDRIQAALLIGELHLHRHDVQYAIHALNDAQKIADTWMGHFDLGRAYLEARQFTAADSEFDNCLRRRGEAVAVFLDDIPTYRYLPMVYYYLGRAQEGIQSPGAMESYQKFMSLKTGDEDPLLADVRRRLGIH